MTRADVEAAVKMVSDWHDGFVRSLRALRSGMKEDAKGAPRALAERVRAQIKSAELNAERIEQVMLAALAAGNRGPSTHAEANMLLYLDYLGNKVDVQDRQQVRSISICTGS